MVALSVLQLKVRLHGHPTLRKTIVLNAWGGGIANPMATVPARSHATMACGVPRQPHAAVVAVEVAVLLLARVSSVMSVIRAEI